MRTVPSVLTSLLLFALSGCAPTSDTNGSATSPEKERLTISWGLENKSTDDVGMATADVSLAVTKADGSTRSIQLGRYTNCDEQAAPEDGPLLTLKCWWAGAGDEFQVRIDATNTIIVDHRALDEMLKVPEFTAVRSIVLPDNVEIVPTVSTSQ